MYHFVWIPKYRHKVFQEPYRTTLKDIIETIGYDYNIEIVEIEVPEDHIHMVVRSENLRFLPQILCRLLKVFQRGNFSNFTPTLRENSFGVGSYGLRVIL